MQLEPIGVRRITIELIANNGMTQPSRFAWLGMTDSRHLWMRHVNTQLVCPAGMRQQLYTSNRPIPIGLTCENPVLRL